jgi:hypothetical protein
VINTQKETTYYTEDQQLISKHRQYVDNRFDEEKGYLFWTQKTGIKQFSDVPFPEELTDAEIGKVTKLAKCIYKDSNMLAYRGNGGIKPHTLKTIGKVLNITDRQTERFIKKMIKLRVMARGTFEIGDRSEIHYFISPIYFFTGKRLNNTLYVLFREDLDKNIPPWIRKRFIDQSGVLPRLVNQQTNLKQ